MNMHKSRILHVLPRFHDVRAPNILCTFESYVFSIWVWTMEQKTHTHTEDEDKVFLLHVHAAF